MIHETTRNNTKRPFVRAAAKASAFLTEYSIEKGIYMKINYCNADHTHALIDLPTRYSIEEVIKLFKGGSSYWINHSQIIKGKFAWAEAMEHFRCHTQMWHGLLDTSPTRKNIIGSGRIRRNTSCLLSGMVWNGAPEKNHLKWLPVNESAAEPQPEGWGE